MRTLLCLLFGTLAVGLLTAQDSPPSLTGSMASDMGWVLLRDGNSQGSTPNWYATSTAQAVLANESQTSRYRIATWMDYHLHENRWSVVLEEAWAEWRPLPTADLRMGRFRHSQGPCQAFNPTNPFLQRDVFDARVGAMGRDGLKLEWDTPPVLLAGTVFLPTDQELPVGLESSGVALTAVLQLPEAGLLGSTEAGLTAARAGGSKSWVSGGWISIDVDGWVAGAEASWDGAVEIALTVNRTFGEVFAVVEAQYTARDPAWMGFGRLSWAHEDLEIAATALTDFHAGATKMGFDVGWNVSDNLEVNLQGSTNWAPEKGTSLGLGARWYL